MNKIEIKRILLDDKNSRLLYDFINGEIILLVTNDENKTSSFVAIDDFNSLTFSTKRDYWNKFMKMCGREVSVNLRTYEEEKYIATKLLEMEE
ncbi:hypothetical protein CN376_22815 [Bacillus cereus]|uniref:hypothetical protein n=1 Tax=Bacillus cereus TaxID=1396 RepID=UPI000BF6C341|nr:hypothetical protein [Bacillus cereus]PEZ87915.1 hypothetical protein CN376_22815 [Bacillus cereus]PFR12633.1 hypothetical protein COK30_13885 [Bacillus cereus]